MKNENEMKTIEQIAELAQNKEFVCLATEYLDSFKYRNELKEEIRNITAFPKTAQIVLDKLLDYQENLVKAEAELESRGLSKTDVFAWQYDTLTAETK